MLLVVFIIAVVLSITLYRQLLEKVYLYGIVSINKVGLTEEA
jgi:hypothetical protein